MKITRMVKRVGRVFNTGNYTTMKVEEEVEAVLDDKDNVDDVDKALFDQATKMMGQDIQRIKDAKKPSEPPAE